MDGDDDDFGLEDSEETGSKKIFIIAGIVLLAIVVLILMWFLLFSGDKESKGTAPGEEMKLSESLSSKIQEGQFQENPIFSEPIKFTVNLRDGKRFLRVTMVVGFVDIQAAEFLTTRAPLVQDTIISTLQNRTTEQLRHPQGVEQLKRALVRKLNTTIFTELFIRSSETGDRSPIKKVLFNEFLLQ